MKISKDLKFYFFSTLLVLFFSFMVLYPSFNLAFQDDDWRGVVLPKTEYADGRLLTPYGIQLWFCGFLYDRFGSNFYQYYILSFILRNSVALGVLIFLYKLTKNKFAALIGGLLLVVGLSGLQTTFETANTNVYIALLGYLVFLGSFFLDRNKLSVKNLIILVLAISFATLASPVRTYPIFAWVFIVDLIDALITCGKLRWKVFAVRQLILLATFALLYKLGLFSWFSLDAKDQNKINNLGVFASQGVNFFSGLNSHILENFIKGLGNIIFPSTIDATGTLSLWFGLGFIAIFLGSLFLFYKRQTQNLYYLFCFILWPLILYAGYFIVVLNGYEPAAKDTFVLESFRRYLLPPFMGFCIFIGILLTVVSNKKNNWSRFLSGVIVAYVLIQAISTYTYLHELSKGEMDGLWDKYGHSW
jgi:hypothetical protein